MAQKSEEFVVASALVMAQAEFRLCDDDGWISFDWISVGCCRLSGGAWSLSGGASSLCGGGLIGSLLQAG